MGLRIKSFIYPIFFFDGGFTKNQYRRGDYLKRGAWTVFRFRGDWQEKGGVFKGGLIPQCTLSITFGYNPSSFCNIRKSSGI